mgnify:CR=1 FL=1|jgi:hypothetical protein|tara:strand:+ start:415 stop:813 length:399 start_codon:yes stop_codon:yes gene_type:complete
MKFSEEKLPSNKKFGYFFTLIFALVTTYFFINSIESWAFFFGTVVVIFFVSTVIKPNVLLPLNKLWMRFGLLLGMIVSPLVLGIIFYGLFTPIAFLMRLSGRDELCLKFKNKTSHWISRDESIQRESFRRQF